MYAKMNDTGQWDYFEADGSRLLVMSPDINLTHYIVNNEKYYSLSEAKRVIRAIYKQLNKTQKLMVEELGTADYIAPNPKYEGRSPVKLYHHTRIDNLIPF